MTRSYILFLVFFFLLSAISFNPIITFAQTKLPYYPEAEKTYQGTYPGSKSQYPKWLVIIASGFHGQRVRDFYKKWVESQPWCDPKNDSNTIRVNAENETFTLIANCYIDNEENNYTGLHVYAVELKAQRGLIPFYATPTDATPVHLGLIEEDSFEEGYIKADGKTVILIEYTENIGSDLVTIPKNSPTTSPLDNCRLIEVDEKQRQEIFNDINNRYKFKITDTNMCSEKDCLNNMKWSVSDLEEIKKTLDLLPGCFINKLNLEEISGRLKQDKKDLTPLNPKALYKESLQQSCCSKDLSEDKGCYWAGTLPSTITFCGDRYKNNSPICKTASEKLGGVTLKGLLVHEMTHALLYHGITFVPQVYNAPLLKSWNILTGWICVPLLGCKNISSEGFPTIYAGISPLEDIAESVRLYYEKPDQLKSKSLIRYEFVKSQIMCDKEYLPSN